MGHAQLQSNVFMNLILMPTAAARLIAVGDASSGRPPLGYQDALDEALIAVEQVVIPRQQPHRAVAPNS